MYDTLLLSHGQRLVAGKFPRLNAHTARDRIRLLHCTPYRQLFTPICPRCALLREHSPPFRILSSMFLPHPSQKATLCRADWGHPFRVMDIYPGSNPQNRILRFFAIQAKPILTLICLSDPFSGRRSLTSSRLSITRSRFRSCLSHKKTASAISTGLVSGCLRSPTFYTVF